jgi:hypothetical protein
MATDTGKYDYGGSYFVTYRTNSGQVGRLPNVAQLKPDCLFASYLFPAFSFLPSRAYSVFAAPFARCDARALFFVSLFLCFDQTMDAPHIVVTRVALRACE